MSTDVLKPQDVFLACALATWPAESWTHRELSEALRVSVGEVNNILVRCRCAKLLVGTSEGSRVLVGKLLDYLVHGVPTTFFPRKVAVAKGVVTGMGPLPFRDQEEDPLQLPLVWPYVRGQERGEGLIPIYPTVPIVALNNRTLYEVMAAVDVLRVGRTRAREQAEAFLVKKFERVRGGQER